MKTLRNLVILGQSLVIIALGSTGAALADSLFTKIWYGAIVAMHSLKLAR